MPTPTNVLLSDINLALGQVPQVDNPILYEALLDIHNAIEALATANFEVTTATLSYIEKRRKVTEVSGPEYTVDIDDGHIRVDASQGDVVITLFPIRRFTGLRYTIKRIDSTPSNTVTLIGSTTLDSGTDLIDQKLDGIRISKLSSYTVESTPDGWDII